MDYKHHYKSYKDSFEKLKSIEGMSIEVSKAISKVIFARFVKDIVEDQDKEEDIVVRTQALSAAYEIVFPPDGKDRCI